MCGKSIQIQVKFDFKAKWKLFYLDICNTFETNQNFSASSFQNMSEINKITSETRFDWILNFVCFFSAFLRFSSLECYDGLSDVKYLDFKTVTADRHREAATVWLLHTRETRVAALSHTHTQAQELCDCCTPENVARS